MASSSATLRGARDRSSGTPGGSGAPSRIAASWSALEPPSGRAARTARRQPAQAERVETADRRRQQIQRPLAGDQGGIESAGEDRDQGGGHRIRHRGPVVRGHRQRHRGHREGPPQRGQRGGRRPHHDGHLGPRDAFEQVGAAQLVGDVAGLPGGGRQHPDVDLAPPARIGSRRGRGGAGTTATAGSPPAIRRVAASSVGTRPPGQGQGDGRVGLQPGQRARVRPSEGVDGLIGVADDDQLGGARGQPLDQGDLGRVDVLVLVDEQVPHPGLLGSHHLVPGQRRQRGSGQVGLVERDAEPAGALAQVRHLLVLAGEPGGRDPLRSAGPAAELRHPAGVDAPFRRPHQQVAQLGGERSRGQRRPELLGPARRRPTPHGRPATPAPSGRTRRRRATAAGVGRWRRPWPAAATRRTSAGCAPSGRGR